MQNQDNKMKIYADIAIVFNKWAISTYAPMVGEDKPFQYLWDAGYRVSRHSFLGIKFLRWAK